MSYFCLYLGVRRWSHNGKKIAFPSNRDDNREIYVMDADGSNQTNITNNDAQDVAPIWSPNGKKIAFRSNRGGTRKIYVMDENSGTPMRLTNTPDEFGELLFDWTSGNVR